MSVRRMPKILHPYLKFFAWWNTHGIAPKWYNPWCKNIATFSSWLGGQKEETDAQSEGSRGEQKLGRHFRKEEKKEAIRCLRDLKSKEWSELPHQLRPWSICLWRAPLLDTNLCLLQNWAFSWHGQLFWCLQLSANVPPCPPFFLYLKLHPHSLSSFRSLLCWKVWVL